MATSFKLETTSLVTFLSTELNSLANGSAALGAEFDNATNLWPFLDVLELNVTFGSNPTAGNTIDIYLVPAPDGTNYDDNQSISSMYIGGFPLRATTSAQKVALLPGLAQVKFVLPPLKVKLRAVNNSGVAFPASGSTIKGSVSRFQAT